MAPRKRKAPEEPPSTPPAKRVTRSATLAAMRLTRSGSKYGSAPISESGSGSGARPSPSPSPVGAEKKKEGKKAKQSKNEAEDVKVEKKIEDKKAKQIKNEVEDVKVEKKKEDKKAKQSKNEVKPEQKVEEEEKGGASSSKPGKTIVIERCNQCQSFKVKATEVKDGLEEKVPSITVKVNPDKPRKGCFEIREEGGEKFISLLNMKRPFKAMKDLDMDKVISDIVDKINGQDTNSGQDTAIGKDIANGEDSGNGEDTVNDQDVNNN